MIMSKFKLSRFFTVSPCNIKEFGFTLHIDVAAILTRETSRIMH